MNTLKEIPVIGRIKHPLRWLIGLMGACVLIVGAKTIYIFVTRETSCEDITQLTVPVQVKKITLQIIASGKVQPIQNVNISPKNPGILTQLYVEQGDQVKQGQIIAQMDSADIQATVAQTRADWKQAQLRSCTW